MGQKPLELRGLGLYFDKYSTYMCMYVSNFLFSSNAQSSLTPVMLAALNGHKEVVEVLIDQCGCSPNEQTEVHTSLQHNMTLYSHCKCSEVRPCGNVQCVVHRTVEPV